MNEIFLILLSSVAVSIDGFICGFACATKKQTITIQNILFMGMFPFIGSFFAMYCAHFLKGLLSQTSAMYVSIVLLLTLSISSFWDARKENDHPQAQNHTQTRDSMLIGAFVSVDASMMAFSYGLSHAPTLLLPPIYSLSHITLIALGIALAKTTLAKKFTKPLSYLACVMFLFMAVCKLF